MIKVKNIGLLYAVYGIFSKDNEDDPIQENWTLFFAKYTVNPVTKKDGFCGKFSITFLRVIRWTQLQKNVAFVIY